MAVQIPFDIDKHDLVSDVESSWFVLNTNIPVKYHLLSDDEHAVVSRRLLGSEDCDNFGNRESRNSKHIRRLPVYRSSRGRVNLVDQNFCVLAFPEKPSRPLFRIEVESEERKRLWLEYTHVEIKVITPDGKEYIFFDGSAKPLKLLPVWFISCKNNRAFFNRGCNFGYHRASARRLATGALPRSSAMSQVARAMGLEFIREEDRRGQDVTAVLERLAEIEREEIEVQLSVLLDIIARPKEPVTGKEFSFLTDNPSVIVPHFDKIIDGLENVVPLVGRDYDENSRRMAVFVGLIHVAPIDLFIENGDRIIDLFEKTDRSSRFWWQRQLIVRLAFIGPESLPIILQTENLRYRDKFLALCRVGASGRSISEPVLLEMWEDILSRTGTGTRIQPITIAMKRIGIPVPTVPEDHVHKKRIVEAKERFRDITPQSPNEMCDMNWHRRRR